MTTPFLAAREKVVGLETQEIKGKPIDDRPINSLKGQVIAVFLTLNIFCANITNMPHTVFFSQKPKSTATTNTSRQRPLHACGVSILSIAEISFAKTQQINGPFGSYLRMMAKLAKFATPLIYAMQYQWLAILSFMDDHILVAERLTEKMFPPSTHVFNKIDELVLIISSVPEKFDGAVNKFPTMIYKTPLVEWALTRVISRLNSLVSILDHWELEYSSIKEKTIGVDRNLNEDMEQSSSKCIPMDSLESFPPISSEAAQKGVHDMMMGVVSSTHHMKGSYKEALLERNPQDDQKKVDDDGGDDRELCEVNVERVVEKGDDEGSVVKCQTERSDSTMGGDVLLKLFDAWVMDPGF